MDHYVLLLHGLYLVFLDHCGYYPLFLVFITSMMLIMYVFMYIYIYIYIYMHIDIDDDDDDDDDYGIQSTPRTSIWAKSAEQSSNTWALEKRCH